ncbi:MAG TPA: signal peptidase I [Edaphobacter sp.]|nr:signal peptidase I [Edaphobacter sp.]
MSTPALTPASARPGNSGTPLPPASPTPRHEPQVSHHIPSPGLLPSVQTLISIIVIAIFIVTFTVQPFRIPSGSMEPTLLIGDFLLVDKEITADAAGSLFLPSPTIHRGDVVVFHFPVNPNVHLVKRVVGIPGDRIRLRGGRVYVNGLRLDEPYAIYRPTGPDNFRDNFPRLQNADPAIDSRWWMRMRKLIDDGELIIPANNYFVLGDNRNDSEDSRYWGFVPRENIVGRPLMVYFSLRQPGSNEYVLPRAAGITLSRPQSDPSALHFARWDRILHIIR